MSATVTDHLYHPQVVHFAIALSFATLLLLLISFFTGRKGEAMALLMGVLAAISGLVAMLTGEKAHEVIHEHFPRVPHELLDYHEEWGERTAYLLLALAILWGVWFFLPRFEKARKPLLAGAYFLALIFLVLTGRAGGSLVYEHGAGVLPLMNLPSSSSLPGTHPTLPQVREEEGEGTGHEDHPHEHSSPPSRNEHP